MEEAKPVVEANHTKEIDDFYDLDYETGVIRNPVSGKRVLVLATGAWVTLSSALRKAFREGAPVYMRQVGYAIGVSLGHNIIGRNDVPSETFKAVPVVARAAGWGKVTYSGDTERWTRYTVRFENCPSCDEDQSGTPPLCDLLVGVVNGISDEIFQRPHRVTETACGYGKDRACEFSVEETKEATEEQKHWASYVLFPWLRSK